MGSVIILKRFLDNILDSNRKILMEYLNLSTRQLQKKISGYVDLLPSEQKFFAEVLDRKFGLINKKIKLSNSDDLGDFLILNEIKAADAEKMLKAKGFTRLNIIEALDRTEASWKGLIQRDSILSPIEYNWLLLALHCHPNNK